MIGDFIFILYYVSESERPSLSMELSEISSHLLNFY